MKRDLSCGVATGALALCLLTFSTASASGWNDYVFDLPYGYLVLRANAFDVHIWQYRDDGCIDEVTQGPHVGALFALAMVDRFILAKNRGLAPEGQPEPVWWTLIDGSQHVTYGPFTEAKFGEKVAELGVPQPIEWKPLRTALKEAARDGRADASQFDRAVIGQIMFLGFSWIVYLPGIMIIAAVLALTFKSQRGWSFRKTFVRLIGLSGILFVCLAALLVF